MRRDDFALAHTLRVRWAEVDMQKVVFNGNYLTYFDVAIAEYWRALAQSASRDFADEYMNLYAVKATVEFHASARYDELIDVSCRVARIGRSSMGFVFGIWRGNEHLISGELAYVYVDPESGKSAPVPQPMRDAMISFERVKPDLGSGSPR
jgi:YbgC/YbaW family acyl-CoA thioester hydrolase